eukprot:218109-Pyramimonas_sp.AAC.1
MLPPWCQWAPPLLDRVLRQNNPLNLSDRVRLPGLISSGGARPVGARWAAHSGKRSDRACASKFPTVRHRWVDR